MGHEKHRIDAYRSLGVFDVCEEFVEQSMYKAVLNDRSLKKQHT